MANKVIGTASDTLLAVKTWANGKFQPKEDGKGLSTNDFTTALLNKLNGIPSDAEKNVIVGVKVNGAVVTPDADRNVNISIAAAPIQEIDVNGTKIDPVEGKVDIEVPTKLSDLTDDLGSSPVHTHSQYIEVTVDNLTNYYKKTETYTQTEVNNLIASARTGGFKVVAELPTASASCVGFIYLVPKSGAKTQNVKDEYICVAQGTTPETYAWEKIGDTEVDLTSYRTAAAQDVIDNGKVDKVEGYGLSKNDYSDAEKGKVTAATEHVADDTIHVTSAQKTAWSAKYDKPTDGIPETDLASALQTKIDGAAQSADLADVATSGSYNDLSDTPDIPQGTVKSVKISTSAPLTGGSDTAQTETGAWTLGLAANYGDTQNPYASKTAGYVLAAPTAAAGVPTFRSLVVADISDLEFMTQSEMLAILNS